ncbi:MAG: recombination protein RecR [Parcubacteria group bacterium]|nr:recombination protein RecR [Parcubacteria group bacterium]
MSLIDRLSQQFSRFPGIGARQARRFVYFLLSADQAFADDLVRNIKRAREEVAQCSVCFRYFEMQNAKHQLCVLCGDESRDCSILLVVEKDADLEVVHKSGVYNGGYFVLNGRLPLSGEGKTLVRLPELRLRLEKEASRGLKEIVFALSANPEGDYTVLELKKALAPLVQKNNIFFSTLGRGLSTGTELEYSDEDTIKSALENRH